MWLGLQSKAAFAGRLRGVPNWPVLAVFFGGEFAGFVPKSAFLVHPRPLLCLGRASRAIPDSTDHAYEKRKIRKSVTAKCYFTRKVAKVFGSPAVISDGDLLCTVWENGKNDFACQSYLPSQKKRCMFLPWNLMNFSVMFSRRSALRRRRLSWGYLFPWSISGPNLPINAAALPIRSTASRS